MQQINQHEVTGHSFSVSAIKQARERSIEAVNAIGAYIKPGITEGEAQTFANQLLLESGMERYWHPTKIRFGKNTLNTFREPSDPRTVLGNNDIFFIDIGPVFNSHEGDYGDTFVVGNNENMLACRDAARQLFHQVHDAWLNDKLSGEALYRYAEQQATHQGWVLNLNTKGHRVSDYPHAIYKACKLKEYSDYPTPHLWILEIQIAHPSQPFGAFFEDLLNDTHPL